MLTVVGKPLPDFPTFWAQRSVPISMETALRKGNTSGVVLIYILHGQRVHNSESVGWESCNERKASSEEAIMEGRWLCNNDLE